MDTQNPSEYYKKRLEEFTLKLKYTKSKLRKASYLRLLIFVLTLVLIYLATFRDLYTVALAALAGIIAFLLTVRHFIKLQKALLNFENLANINKNELKVLNGDYSAFDNGAEFADPDHSFAADLDIFGETSLYQYFNRCATSPGKLKLAGWFLHPYKQSEHLAERQGAVSELSQKVDWRQEFLASGYQTKESLGDRDSLLEWIAQPAEFSHWKFMFLVIFIPILTFTLIGLIIAGIVSPAWLLLYLAVPLGALGFYIKKINLKHQQLEQKSALMEKYSGLLSVLEKEDFSSPEMSRLKASLKSPKGLPSEATRHLSHILDAFDNRQNLLMGIILNFLLLWDLIQVMRIEKWQAEYKDELPRWMDVLAGTDAFCSLANFHFNHPGSVFPEISQKDEIINAKGLGHPLIRMDNMVVNPALIPSWKHFTIITGANMAGKSTYLRTVGVNIILAMMGSAVIATEMSFTVARMITSIRTRDSLQRNESYFYAELKRLKMIIDRLKAGEKLIILLDEILKGTNSKDKQSGSFALLEKLMRFGACGFVATHDLALGELEEHYPQNISNKSFEVIIENDKLVFDYKIKEGIARQMNATYLMKKMGITGDDEG